MRLIDADELKKALAEMWYESAISITGVSISELIDNAPTIVPSGNTKSCGVSADKSTDQNVADVPIDDLVSRADAIDSINKTNSTLDEIPICKDIRSAFANAIKALPSADRPTENFCRDCPIYSADRLQVNSAEWVEQKEREFEELRKQILQYGASMCHSADRPSADVVHKPDYSYEADMVKRLKEATSADRQTEYNLETIADIVKQLGHLDGCIADILDRQKGEWIVEDHNVVCSICGQNNLETNYCPNCGAIMKGGQDE